MTRSHTLTSEVISPSKAPQELTLGPLTLTVTGETWEVELRDAAFPNAERLVSKVELLDAEGVPVAFRVGRPLLTEEGGVYRWELWQLLKGVRLRVEYWEDREQRSYSLPPPPTN